MAGGRATERGAAPAAHQPLPDLLHLSLAELRELSHPVLREVLAELRERIARPDETMWDFNQGPAAPDDDR
ncbi:FXSXX-COOH protein [Streptomyces sp. 7-21]|nr:FXSXX-COOH protein [Streptomyces sp. 7-21]